MKALGCDDESFDEFYTKLNDIVNSTYNLGEIYDQPKIVRKILRSLTENFRPKVTAINESKDVDSIPIDVLVGSLQSYELDLKLVDDVDVGGFDDELSATKIAYLVKNFRNFLETTTEEQEIRTLLYLEILGRMIPLRLTTLKNLEKK